MGSARTSLMPVVAFASMGLTGTPGWKPTWSFTSCASTLGGITTRMCPKGNQRNQREVCQQTLMSARQGQMH